MGRRRADEHASTAYAAHGEQARIQQLMTEIEAARATQWRDSGIANVCDLLRLLESTSETAAAALEKPYGLRNSID
jgi:hypothetical protein